jgi:hypothetical protein
MNKLLQKRIEDFLKGWVMFDNLVFLAFVLAAILLSFLRFLHVL